MRLRKEQEQNLKRARELEELQRRKEAARAELENLKSGN
jgi:cell division protein FtsB